MNRVLRRRDFLARAGVAAAGLGLAPEGRAAATPARRPNIVIVLTDDMGFSDLGCYGGEIATPHLDALAAAGLRFTQFYNTARCCPTRASLLTGLHPHQAAVGHMTGARTLEGYRGDLNPDAATLAEVLRGADYRTYMCGKWHVTRHERKPDDPNYNWPLQRGFQRFYGTITGGGSFYDPTTLCRDNTFVTPENDPEYRPARFYYTDAIGEQAARFVREHAAQHAGTPFFLYVAFTAAHWPMHAPEEDVAKYRGRYDGGYGPARAERFRRLRELGILRPGWDLSPQEGDWSKVEHKAWEARCMEVYAAMVDRMDRNVGRLVAALKETGVLDDTLLLYLQDNGACAEPMGRTDNPAWHLEGPRPMGPDELQPAIWPPMRTRDGRAVLGGPGVMPGPADTYIGCGRDWANVSNTPFRRYKHYLHEGGISTPLIAHWPNGIARRGELEHQPGQLTDLMATCVDVSGAAYPAARNGRPVPPMEGRSLAPAFRGRTIERDGLFWEHEGNRAVRVGRWKLVAENPDGPWELYDLEADRTELHDLAAAQPERVRELAAKWEQWARRVKALPWPWKPAYGSAVKAAPPASPPPTPAPAAPPAR